jgi:hypothetical protein
MSVRDGERGGLDHDRRTPRARHERLDRFAREWERECVANGGRDVDDPRRRRGHPEDDVVVADGNVDDPRAGKKRYTTHRSRVDTVAV